MLPAAPSAAAPLAGENGCVRDVADPGQPMPDEKPSKAVPTLLRLDEAHRVSRGQGVGVAVIDSGVDAGTGALDVRGGLSVGGARGGRPEDAHGTIVAGLVAGDDQKRGIVGIAPDAHVVPIRVLDGDSEVVDEGLRLESGNLAAGIREAIKLRNSQNIRVINLSLVLDAPSRAVADAIAAAQKAGILVVVRGRQPAAGRDRHRPRRPLQGGREAGPVPGHGEGRPRGHRAGRGRRPGPDVRVDRARHRRVRPGGARRSA